MADEVKIHVSDFIPEFLEVLGGTAGVKVFPNLVARLNMLAYQYMEMWRSFASGHPIPGTPQVVHSRGNYIRSIYV